MKVFRDRKGENATMIFEMDNRVSEENIQKIRNLELINRVISINSSQNN